jgi:hypothetical protein
VSTWGLLKSPFEMRYLSLRDAELAGCLARILLYLYASISRSWAKSARKVTTAFLYTLGRGSVSSDGGTALLSPTCTLQRSRTTWVGLLARLDDRGAASAVFNAEVTSHLLPSRSRMTSDCLWLSPCMSR